MLLITITDRSSLIFVAMLAKSENNTEIFVVSLF